jgi:hypothetical protein
MGENIKSQWSDIVLSTNTFPVLHNFNEMYTPPEAVDIISKYLPKDKIYWEACYGMWHFASRLRENGFNVIWHKDIDCLNDVPSLKEREIFITNPPFNWNKKFIKRAIELWKPFIFLIRLEHLGGVEASRLLKDLWDYTIIIPEKRINYITPKMMRWEKVWWSPFHSIFLTYWLWLWSKIIYD